MASYPRNLGFYIKSLSGYKRENYKLNANISATQSVPSNSKISFRLPQNCLVDFDTFTLYYTPSVPNGHVLSKNSESVIRNVSVEANGRILDAGCPNHYNLFQRKVFDLTLGDKLYQRSKYHNSVPDITIATASNVSPDTNKVRIVNNFAGFVGTCQPRTMDLSLVGDVTIHIQLAGNEVMVKHSGATTTDWSMTNVYATIDVVSIDDGNYYEVLKQQLGEKGKLVVPFQTFTSISQGLSPLTQTTQSTIATESLDMLVGTYQQSNYLDRAPVTACGSSAWFKTGSSNLQTAQLGLNGKYLTDRALPPHEIYNKVLNDFTLTQDSVISPDVFGDDGTASVITDAQWLENHFIVTHRFNHPTSADDRLKSGVNLLGTNASVSFKSDGTENNVVPVLFAVMTKELEIYPFKQLNIVE
jgi:hypothetical protein